MPDTQVPPLEQLSQRQQRGMDCVHCGITLTPATAVDLGPRKIKRLDYVTQWYPRACNTHGDKAATR